MQTAPGAAGTLHHAEYIPRMPDGIMAHEVSSPRGDAGEGRFLLSMKGVIRCATALSLASAARCYYLLITLAIMMMLPLHAEPRRSPMRSGDDMLRQIVDKSALDTDFREQLLADPKATISGELGITIPDSMNIQVHESDMQTVHLALPPDPNITEEQLEAISAGLCCCW